MRAPSRLRGLSLIELMIALVIGTVLMLGLVQVFGASRSAYQLSEGMSRSQENGRFAIDFLQRDIRMAGHFGCVNDQAHAQNTPPGMYTTFASPADPALDFDISIQGYEANGTGPATTLALPADPASGGNAYTPALPAVIADATSNRVPGSDILTLRYLAPEGVPVTAITGTMASPDFSFESSRWEVLRSGVETPGLFGIADCLNSVVFQAESVDPASGLLKVGAAELNASGFTRGFVPGQALLHRAESIVYYVGVNASGRPSLYRARFNAKPDATVVVDRQELVEGIENLQFLYGQDRIIDPAKEPSGFVDRQVVASDVVSGAVAADDAWRRVGAVRVGLVAVSPDRATAPQATGDHALRATGVVYTAPEDGRYRATYQTTVALRNRLYGN